MLKTIPIIYPTYPEGTRQAIALAAFQALLAEKPGWCKQNHVDRHTLNQRVQNALAAQGIAVGADKAKALADRVVNETCHLTRKAAQGSKRLNVDRWLNTVPIDIPLPQRQPEG